MCLTEENTRLTELAYYRRGSFAYLAGAVWLSLPLKWELVPFWLLELA